MKSGMRPLEELKPEILRRTGRANPFEWVKREDAEEVVSMARVHRRRPLGGGVGPDGRTV